MNQQQLVSHSEEPNELGGYFIINGLEKIIRMLIVPRRNDVIRYQLKFFLIFFFFSQLQLFVLLLIVLDLLILNMLLSFVVLEMIKQVKQLLFII